MPPCGISLSVIKDASSNPLFLLLFNLFSLFLIFALSLSCARTAAAAAAAAQVVAEVVLSTYPYYFDFDSDMEALV